MGRGADQDKGVAPGSSPKRPVEGGCEDCWKMLVMAGKLLAAGALVVEKVKLLLGPAERTKTPQRSSLQCQVTCQHGGLAAPSNDQLEHFYIDAARRSNDGPMRSCGFLYWATAMPPLLQQGPTQKLQSLVR